MDAAERKRLVLALRKHGVVLIGSRFITSVDQLPSIVDPPILGDPIFDDPEDSREENRAAAPGSAGPRTEGHEA
jgi:hypothetical protein